MFPRLYLTASSPQSSSVFALLLAALGALAGIAPAAFAAEVDRHFPTTPGRWWYYATQIKIRDEPRQQRLFIANVAYDGRTLLQRRQGVWDHLYAIDEQAVAHQAYLNRTGDGREAREAPAVLLPLPPTPGTAWQFTSRLRLIESRTFSAEDRLSGRLLPVDLNASIAAIDDVVQVPAGRFEDCVRVEATGVALVSADRGNLEVEVRVTQIEWYAPDVGLVKSTRLEATDSPFLRNGEYLQELLEVGS